MSELPIQPVSGVAPSAETKATENEAAPGFSDSLKEALQEVNELQTQSTTVIEKALDGEMTDVHSAMLALQKADLSFQLMLQVRNKLVQAYRDVMRLQG